MELKIKRGLSGTQITNSSDETIFIIKSKNFFNPEKMIFRADGSAAYSVKSDPKPLDRRDKYIFTDYSSKNEFYAWVDSRIYESGKSIPLCRYLLFTPIEIESFFGELCIRRSGISKFDIYINNRKKGTITSRKITCEDIDDAGLPFCRCQSSSIW